MYEVGDVTLLTYKHDYTQDALHKLIDFMYVTEHNIEEITFYTRNCYVPSLNINRNITYFAHVFCDIPNHLYGDAGKITRQSCDFFLAYPFQIVFNKSTYLPTPYIPRL